MQKRKKLRGGFERKGGKNYPDSSRAGQTRLAGKWIDLNLLIFPFPSPVIRHSWIFLRSEKIQEKVERFFHLLKMEKL